MHIDGVARIFSFYFKYHLNLSGSISISISLHPRIFLQFNSNHLASPASQVWFNLRPKNMTAVIFQKDSESGDWGGDVRFQLGYKAQVNELYNFDSKG